jgi:hypothetical protein
MRAKWLRLGVVAALSAFLLIFFVPFIPVHVAPPVTVPCVGVGYCIGGISGVPPPGALNYLSLGFYLFHWGASYQYFGGFTTPPISFSQGQGGTSTLDSTGFLLFFILPIIAATIALLGFRRVTVLTSLPLMGWGILVMYSGVQQAAPLISADGYLMVVFSASAIVAAVWGRRITSYWNVDSESLPLDS